MNQLTARYKLKSSTDLIKIINTPSDYQELAIETAKEELLNRGVTDYNIIESESNNKIIEDSRITTSINNNLNTYFENKSNEDKIILGLCILLIPWAILGLYGAWSLLKPTFLNERYGTLIFVAFLIMPTISTVLFWKRMKVGWVLISFLLTYSIIESISKYLNAYLYDTDGMTSSFVFIIILGAFLYFICKPTIRDIYKINDKLMRITIGSSLCVAIIIYQTSMN